VPYDYILSSLFLSGLFFGLSSCMNTYRTVNVYVHANTANNYSWQYSAGQYGATSNSICDLSSFSSWNEEKSDFVRSFNGKKIKDKKEETNLAFKDSELIKCNFLRHHVIWSKTKIFNLIASVIWNKCMVTFAQNKHRAQFLFVAKAWENNFYWQFLFHIQCRKNSAGKKDRERERERERESQG